MQEQARRIYSTREGWRRSSTSASCAWLFNQPAAPFMGWGISRPRSIDRWPGDENPTGMAPGSAGARRKAGLPLRSRRKITSHRRAFGRRYDTGPDAPAAGPYLERRNYESIKRPFAAASASFHVLLWTEYLQRHGDRSIDCFVLLDAQDWMTGQRSRAVVDRDYPHRQARGAAGDLPHRAENNLLYGRVPGPNPGALAL